MKNSVKAIFYIFISFMLSLSQRIVAQEQSGNSPQDQIVFSALEDEISRDMDSLRLPDHEPPFYMAFRYSNAEILTISASLGGILQESHKFVPSYASRLMIGDYTITDENFESSSTIVPAGETGIQIDLPQHPDYYGIRRAVWASMESLFRSANMHYKIKKAFLSKNNIRVEDYFPADFSIEKARVMSVDAPPFTIDTALWEKTARELSGIFVSYPEIENANISVNLIKADIYFVNSEGFRVKFPFNVAVVQGGATIPMAEGDPISESFLFVANSPSEMPDLEQMKERVEQFAGYMMSMKDAEVLQEKYAGPIILTGDAASKYIFHCLFNNSDALIAKRIPLEDNSTNLYMPTEPPYNSIEAKIGDKIFHPSLSVYDVSKDTTYQEIPLLGHFDVDADGIVPPDSYPLIQKGVLSNLLTNRIPNLTYNHSSGHDRGFVNSQGGLQRGMAPGILKVVSSKQINYNKLVKQAKRIAKLLDLDYYLVVKDMFGEKPVGVYKVDVHTGKETLVRGIKYLPHPISALDERVSFGKGENVVNTIFNVPVSIISPASLLVPKVEIFGVSRVEKNRLPVVKSPLQR